MKKTFTVLLICLSLSGCPGKSEESVSLSPPADFLIDTVSPIPTVMPSLSEEPTVINQSSAFNPANLPADLIQILQDNRAVDFAVADPNVLSVIEGYQTSGLDPDIDAAIAEQVLQAGNAADKIDYPQTLTHEQIQSELDYLFNLLKYGYSGYEYFGGDDAFGAAKQAMEIKLATMSDPMSMSRYMNKVLSPYLKPVISDNHFNIYNTDVILGFGTKKNFYAFDEFYFYKSGNDYITTIDGTEYRLIDDNDAYSYLLPTIDRDGKLSYILGTMLDAGVDYLDVTINFINTQTGETINKLIFMTATSYDYLNDLYENNSMYDFYTEYTVDSIPVLANHSLYVPDTSDMEMRHQISKFFSTGSAFRNYPIAVLDLRSNIGGNSGYAKQDLKRVCIHVNKFLYPCT